MIDFLAVHWNVSPEIFHIGSFAVRWYSLLWVVGFVLGWYIFKWYFKREGLPLSLLDPLLITLIVASIIGARLGHCLFYDRAYYLAHPLEILMIWKGGLASHGGAIAIVLAMGWYAHKYGRKNGFDTLWILDRLCIAVCFVGALIRIGNLMNSEICGNPTDLPWGFIFERAGGTVPQHPTQIYEALAYTILGFCLLAMYKCMLPKLKRGTILGIFFIVLFGVRFLIEFIKEPQVESEVGLSLNYGQQLSIPFIIIGIGLLVWSLIYGKPATVDKVGTPRKPKEPTHYAHAVKK